MYSLFFSLHNVMCDTMIHPQHRFSQAQASIRVAGQNKEQHESTQNIYNVVCHKEINKNNKQLNVKPH